MNVGDVVTLKGIRKDRRPRAQVVRVLRRRPWALGADWGGWVEVDPPLCNFRRHAIEDLELVRRAPVIVDGRHITDAERVRLMGIIEREDDGLPEPSRQLVPVQPRQLSPAVLPPGLEHKRLRAIQWMGHRWLLRDAVRRR